MQNQESNSKHCISYAPGHNVHWIQARVKYFDLQYEAEIEFTEFDCILVTFLGRSEIFFHHNLDAIRQNLEDAVLGYVKYSPTAGLLYIQTEQPSDSHKGVFALHYLSDAPLLACEY